MSTINIESLTQAAKVYAPFLSALPYMTYNEAAASLNIRILEVKGEHILVNNRRRAGILNPYTPGKATPHDKEIMKFLEMSLKPERTYADIRDNVTNYDDVLVISNQGNFVDNKSKQHPLELEVLKNIITSYSEDVLNSMFFAERDTDIHSPLTAFNGFNTKIDKLVTAGLISEEEKNLVATGELTAPLDENDTEAYSKLVAFIASAHPLLRRGKCYLYIAEDALINARDAYKNKVKGFTDPDMDQFISKLRADANALQLTVLTHPALGAGSRLMLTGENVLDFGVGATTDDNFVQVRNVEADPNEVQFWIQASYDTRINDIHHKIFQMNDGVNVSLELAGDYQ